MLHRGNAPVLPKRPVPRVPNGFPLQSEQKASGEHARESTNKRANTTTPVDENAQHTNRSSNAHKSHKTNPENEI